jgi:DNA-directed RNA polymerase subunit K/omega
MSRLILAAERVRRARQLIQNARDLPVPPASEAGKYNFSYVAHVKAFLQDARDLVKYISKTPSATAEIKEEVIQILLEADRANQEILH